MPDDLVRLHLKQRNLLVVAVVCTRTARRARDIHGCLPTSAGLLAQAFAAGFGVAGLLGGGTRINLQVSCDGPLRGLFVDASADGAGRGYVRNPSVNFLSSGPSFEGGGALGGSGVLSVIRELGRGEFYRSSVALERFDLALDLERYYRESEQIDTLVQLEVLRDGPESLGKVGGLFVQALPGAAAGEVRALGEALGRDALARAFGAGADRARELARPLLDLAGGEVELLAGTPVEFACTCSSERALTAVAALGRAAIEDLLRREGKAVATCTFCHARHEVPDTALARLLGKRRRTQKPN